MKNFSVSSSISLNPSKILKLNRRLERRSRRLAYLRTVKSTDSAALREVRTLVDSIRTLTKRIFYHA